jgi:hypothetical protein
LRISYGILNLTRRESYEQPSALEPGRRYRVSIPLNYAGAAFPTKHRIRIALSTTYWPLMWPSPERATVTIYRGSLALPVHPSKPADALLRSLPEPETAVPEPVTITDTGARHFARINLDVSSAGDSRQSIEGDDPLSAVVEARRADILSRGDWKVRVETTLRLSCTRNSFIAHAGLRAWHGENTICDRIWDSVIPRDLM